MPLSQVNRRSHAQHAKGRRVLLLTVALWLWCWCLLPSGSGETLPTRPQPIAPPPSKTINTTVLTTVSQVQALSQEKVAKLVPVKLRGVVTAFSGWKDYYFLQDATGGIAINRDEHGVLHRGDEIELEGTTEPGLFTNSVVSKRVRIIGRAPMPQVATSTYADLDGGSKDAEWVRVRGIVQAAAVEDIWDKRVLVLSLDIGGAMIKARVPDFSQTEASDLIDAVVEVEGVCGTVFNDKRQYSGLRLFVPALSEVRIKEPAPANPFNLSASPVRSLFQFRPDRRGHHRVKIAGTVTYQHDGHSLYMQEGKDGILVSLVEDRVVPVGSRIEAVGFAGLNGYSPTLANAVLRTMDARGTIEPASIRGADFVKNYNNTFLFAPYDGQLVHVQGEVISPLALPNEDAWLLQDGHANFVASMQRKTDGNAVTGIETGSILSATGVMSVTQDSNGQPISFRVLIRGPEDVAVLERAPWWNLIRLAIALGVLLAATLTAVLWTVVLKRQVRQKTSLLRDSERRFRTLAEHDTLTGLGNRAYLHEKLEQALQEARITSHPMGLVMLNLDHFKKVNETLGHDAGDQLLRVVADRIRTCVRGSDVVARISGDEFVVLLTTMAGEADAATIGTKLVATVAVPTKLGTKQVAVSASVGLCTFPTGGASADSLLQRADEAMHRAKAKGRNNCCVYEGEGKAANGRMTPSSGQTSSRAPLAQTGATDLA